MKLEEAIEIIDNYLRGDEPDDPRKLPAAFRLGIEALRAIPKTRAGQGIICIMHLPGETED